MQGAGHAPGRVPDPAPETNRMETEMNLTGYRHLGLAALALALAASGGPAAAQQIRPGGNAGQPVARATTYDPERVRALMMSIHGYTREGLEGASTNVPEILMTLAGDGREETVVRRQSVKGLSLYPTEEVLTFIEKELVSAPLHLKRLYLNSLGGFAQGFPDRVSTVAETYLNDPELVLRYSALKLTGRVGQTPRVRTMLETRLTHEPDLKLRKEIEKRLGPG